jgi:hypothetical protein
MKYAKINDKAQFFIDMTDESKLINVNGNDIPLGYWNLVLTMRDLSMYIRTGLKPHRHWKITDVKRYFGMKGSAQLLLEQLTYYKEIVLAQ